MSIKTRPASLRLASGADLVSDFFSAASQPQKNVVSRVLFAIADGAVFATCQVVDDADDHMAFFVIAGGDIVIKARIRDFGSFDILSIGSSEREAGWEAAAKDAVMRNS